MFNPVAPAQLVTVLGTVLRDSAEWQRPLEPFQVGQLLSASSIARYVAAELNGGAEAWQNFRCKLEAAVDAEARRAGDGQWARAIAVAAGRIADLYGPQELGTYLAELLDLGRNHGSATFPVFRAELHGLFGELIEAEVGTLAGERG